MDDTLARLTLEGVSARITEREDARDWAAGTYEPLMGEIVPKPAGDTTTRQDAWKRHLKQIQSQGPRVLNVKLGAALGDVTWGKGEDKQEAKVDDRLKNLRLTPLATELLRAYLVDGIMACMAHAPAEGAEPRITRLGGYLEPYFDPADMDRVTGLYQAWQVRVGTKLKWNVRVYDFENPEDATIRQWVNLESPTNLGTPPVVTDNAPVPRFRIYERSHDGLVLSPVLQALPLFKALWATEARLVSVEEFALPILTGVGGWEKDLSTGRYPGFHPGALWTGPAGAKLEFVSLANQLEELRQQRKFRLESIREFLGLPGGFLGNDAPSGEALREANIRMSQNASRDATDTADVLTEAVADLCELVNAKPVPVSVSINRAYDKPETIADIVTLQGAGLLPFDVAARAIQQFFGDYSDEELRAFIASQTSRITNRDLQNSFSLRGGEDDA